MKSRSWMSVIRALTTNVRFVMIAIGASMTDYAGATRCAWRGAWSIVPRTDEFVQPRGIVNYFPSDGGIWGG
jgi:hypothetical protein